MYACTLIKTGIEKCSRTVLHSFYKTDTETAFFPHNTDRNRAQLFTHAAQLLPQMFLINSGGLNTRGSLGSFFSGTKTGLSCKTRHKQTLTYTKQQ